MSKQFKLLLLGYGDIAGRLVGKLPGEYYDITGLRRSGGTADAVTVLTGDACDPHTMASLMAIGFDAVVVTMTPSERSEAGYRNSYYRSMAVLLQALSATGQAPLVLYVSSTRVYGHNSGEWVDEQSVTAPAGFAGNILLETERLLQASATPHCIVRFSGIYGPGRTAQLKPVLNGVPLTSPFGWTNRIHSEDCAGVLAHLLEKHRVGDVLEPIYLASDDEPVMQWQLREYLSELLGVAVHHSLESEFEESGKRCRNRRLKASGYRWRFPDYRSGYTALIGQPGNLKKEPDSCD